MSTNLPRQEFSILANGLGLVDESPNRFVFLGPSSKGTANVLQAFSQKQDIVDAVGYGPAPEDAAYAMGQGGSLLFMKTGATVAGANGSVTATPIGSATGTITLAGAPYDSYTAIVEIMTTGTVGIGEFRYSLDNGLTYSEKLTIPSGGAYVIPNTGITATFVPGAGATFFEAGDIHTWASTGPSMNATDLGTAITALRADLTTWPVLVISCRFADASSATTFFSALSTHLDALEGDFRFVRAIVDAGSDDEATTTAAFDAVEDDRILVVYGNTPTASGLVVAGRGFPSLGVGLVAGRAAKVKISTALHRFASGALSGASATLLSHDERKNESVDSHKLTTFRTWLGSGGAFITRGRLKAPAGSDFQFWQLGRVMDEACRITYEAQKSFIARGLRTTTTGALDERDAGRLESQVQSDLEAGLLQPTNDEGTKGHVSSIAPAEGLGYKIDRTNNVQTSGALISTVALRPLAYPDVVQTTMGYAISVPVAA